MKFGKEFASQMVPEWQEAYMDYDYLKTILKEIQNFKKRTRPPAAIPSGLKRNLTLYRTFSGLTHWQRHPPEIESQVILMNSVNHHDGSVRHQTTFLKPEDEGGEYELVYFRRLDDEFNKVDRFYRSKVEEVMKEAAMLNKQMDALIAFRIKVENPLGYFDRFVEMSRFASNIATSTAALAASTSSGLSANNILPKQEKECARLVSMEVIEEGGPSTHDRSDEESGGDKDDEESETITNIKGTRPAPLEILDRVKMNKTLETPGSTIKGVLQVPRNTELNFNRENLTKVKAQLRKAFKEFYQKLRLLKSYSFLNVTAFSKIMKKYDKINSRNAAKSYMNMVDNSFLGSSDEITKLMERVEATFIKHFSNSNRSKGMNILRPKERKERHWITFSMGFFAGCTIALILALILIIRAHKIMGEEGDLYMDTMFPLYSLFAFIVLHMLMYAGNIYFWRRYRVNYSFIFGFKQGTELGYREVLLFSFGLAVLALSSVLSNLDMEMDPKTKDYKALTELLPLFVILLVVVILLLPFNILYRSSRFFFLTCLLHCVCAPLYKVTLPDFLLADQLTSQVQAFRSIEFYVCYYGWGDFSHRRNTCINDAYNTFYFIVAVIPFSWRLLQAHDLSLLNVVQCLRRAVEEKDRMQGYNAVKYFLIIVAVCMTTAYSLNKGTVWKVMAWIISAIAATFSTYWDIVFNWGLLQRKSNNRWLRDKLLVPNKNVYYVAIVLDVLLRFSWLQIVLDFNFSILHKQTMIAIVASLEIIRRGIWNFFRLENEHLNNVGKFRAFKSVPLPFNYEEEDDKDE